MVRTIENRFKPQYRMIDTWKKDNSNNKKGYYKKFENKEKAVEVCDLNNIDEFGMYNNRFIIK